VTIINGASVAQTREVKKDATIALAITAHGILTSTEFSWTVLGLAVAKTLMTTATSYVMRIKMGSMLIEPNKAEEPVTVMVGGYELELQRPGKADHAQPRG
jgi:hypothetical protein